jgi:chromosome segregation ATPase
LQDEIQNISDEKAVFMIKVWEQIQHIKESCPTIQSLDHVDTLGEMSALLEKIFSIILQVIKEKESALIDIESKYNLSLKEQMERSLAEKKESLSRQQQLEDKLNRLDFSLKEKDVKITSLNNDLMNLQNIEKDKNRQIEDLKEKFAHLEKSMSELQRNIENELSFHAERLDVLWSSDEDICERLKQVLFIQKEKLERNKREVDFVKEEYNKLKEENEKLKRTQVTTLAF